MNKMILFAALALLVGRPASEKNYTGPKCLGPFCVDHAVPTRTLFTQLGPPAPRASQFSPYCYEARDGKAYLNFDTVDSEPGVTAAVFLSDFPNCLHMGKRVAADDFGAWETPEGIKIGSSEDDVIKAYGKPSSEDKITSRAYRSLIRGYRHSDTLPVIPEKILLYNDATGRDLSAAEFGIRNGKVSYISLSHNE